MGIKKDAGSLVLHIYKNKIKGNTVPQVNKLIKSTGWEPHRFSNAIEYCEEKYFLMIARETDTDSRGINNMEILGLTSEGIDIIEATEWNEEGKKQFAETFNITINNEFNVENLLKGEMKLF